MITIRQETPADHAEIYSLIQTAFASAEHRDGNEQDLVVMLRNSMSFIPELSLVAIEDGNIVGHILFTKALVNNVEILALAPLAVLPKYQNRGIGLALIERGHYIARRLGYRYSVVLGHSKYYPKAGYVPADTYGINAPFAIESESFMAICLDKNAGRLDGVVKYDKAFGV